MSQDVEIHLRAYDEASNVIQQVGYNMSSVFTDIEGRTQSLAAATDQATSQISLDYDDVQFSMKALADAEGDAQMSTRDTVMSMNNLALSGAALVMSFERVEKSQVMSNRANLMVQRSTETLEKAQLDYNKAIDEYGTGSAEAQTALDKLNIAQEAYNVAVERATMASNNFNMSMVTSALMVIPSLIGIIGTLNALHEAGTLSKIANAAASYALAAAEAVQAAATYVASAAMAVLDVVMDANPIFLVIAAIGALIAALVLIPGALDAVINAFRAVGDFFGGIAGDIGNAWGGFVGIFTGGNKQATDSVITLTSAVQNVAKPMTEAEYLTGLMTNASANFEAALQAADKTLLESNDILATNAATYSEYKDKVTAASDEIKRIDSQIADLNKTYNASIGALITQTMGMQAMNELMPGVHNNVDLLKTKEADLKTQLDITTGSLEKDKAALEAQQKAANDAISFIDDLTKKYDEMKASADTNLGAVKASFDAAFNAGDFDKALSIVKDFANKYSLSLSDAEKIIDSFKAAQATIPKSIEDELIGKAQADLKTFQECATGKFAGLHGDSTASMNQLVTDTNDLISHGLVGQAQDNIKAYVTCATDKHAQLVSTIEADLAKLRKDYAAGAADLAPMIKQLEEFKLAATFGQPGVDIYAAIKLAGTTASDVAAQTETATTQIADSFNNLTNNVTLSAKVLQHNIVSGSIWTDMLTQMEDTTEKSIAKIHAQFQTLKAEDLAGGGFGAPEALPGAGGRAPVILHITAPLINIEGSADKATVDLATKQVLDKLKSIIVEPTTSYASSTQKRIRQGAVTY